MPVPSGGESGARRQLISDANSGANDPVCRRATRATRCWRPRSNVGRRSRETRLGCLIPADWNPQALMDQYDADRLSDTDPRPRADEEIKRL